MAERLAKRTSPAMKEVEAEVTRLMGKFVPTLRILKVDAVQQLNFEGEPSLFLQVLLARHMRREEIPGRMSVRAELRAWLLDHGEERFPYIEFVTKADIEERRKSD